MKLIGPAYIRREETGSKVFIGVHEIAFYRGPDIDEDRQAIILRDALNEWRERSVDVGIKLTEGNNDKTRA